MLRTAKPESMGQYEIKGKTEDICLKPDMPFAFQVPEGNKNTYNFSLFFFPIFWEDSIKLNFFFFFLIYSFIIKRGNKLLRVTSSLCSGYIEELTN